jgi:glycosyltransferase involved in cell wall biosynthesis
LTRPPSVSVVIPAFSRADTIERAIRSVTAQTFHDYEIIVVDDGSTDRTVEVVKALQVNGLKLIEHGANKGAAAARNTGVAIAHGRWIAFLDSDDFWAPDKLANQIAVLEMAGPAARACVTGFRMINCTVPRVVYLEFTSTDFRKEILFGCSVSPGSTLLVERAVFQSVGSFDENMMRLEDWDWLLRFTRSFDLVAIREPLATIDGRLLSKSDTPDFDRNTLAALEVIRHRHMQRVGSLADRQRLRSSLFIERAAIASRRGRKLRAMTLVAIALIMYPFRNAMFFTMLGRNLRRLVR